MQRAEINEYLNEFIAVLKQYQFHLPAFAHYDLNDWQQQSANLLPMWHKIIWVGILPILI